MKFCKHCGAQLEDETAFCMNCGYATDEFKKQSNSETLKTIAKIFMILGCIVWAWGFLIPLCWTIPMTVKYWNNVKYNRPTSTAFKVCSLIFVNLVAGIIMLCDDDN